VTATAACRHRRRGSPAAVAAHVAVAATLALALAATALAGCGRDADWVAGSPLVAGGQAGGAGTTALPTAGDPAPAGTAAPQRLRIPDIDVDAALQLLHLQPDGTLAPPQGWVDAGWYGDGTRPGDTGPAVIAGHVDSRRGPAVFYKLRELEAGDRIEVVRGGRTIRFTVISTAWYPKNTFPNDQVYGPTPDRQLRLITCGGVFDHRLRSYKDNLVVYAVAR
jgi:sortase (surface protein transpeptidase)